MKIIFKNDTMNIVNALNGLKIDKYNQLLDNFFELNPNAYVYFNPNNIELDPSKIVGEVLDYSKSNQTVVVEINSSYPAYNDFITYSKIDRLRIGTILMLKNSFGLTKHDEIEKIQCITLHDYVNSKYKMNLININNANTKEDNS